MSSTRFLTNILRTGLPFGFFLGIFSAFFTHGIYRPVIGAAIGGLLFGLCMAGFVEYQRRQVRNRPTFSDEELIYDGPANHLFRGEGVGGWLYLTTGRLFFQSHRINLQPHETDLPLNEIAEAAPALTARFIPNGLLVSTVSGTKERFVVDGRNHWSAAIASAKVRPAGQP